MSRIACASRAACLLVAPFLASPTLAEQVRDPKGAYSFEPPQGWKISLGEGNVSVVNPLNSAGLMIVVGPKVLDDLNIFANVILNSLKSQTPDRKETGRQGTQLCGFDALLQDMIPEMKKHCTSWTLVGTRPLPVAGRQGLNARIESVTQGVELHTDCVLVQNERNLLVVMCICPKTDFAANQLKFGHILDSLRFAADAAPQEPDERNLLNPPLR
ncbi:MAG: hypothetical protein FJ290_09030 [Planctomycetes bacterium]|nr:hypothetical protein [Planctomycetota bacterium]